MKYDAEQHRANLERLYRKRLAELPKPGGNHFHNKAFGVAGLGVMAGLSKNEIVDDLMTSAAGGTRPVTDKYLESKIVLPAWEQNRSKAIMIEAGVKYTPKRKPKPILDGMKTLSKWIERGTAAGITDEVAFWECSPIRVTDEPAADIFELFRYLYKPDELIFMGDRYDDGSQRIHTIDEWIKIFDARKIMLNCGFQINPFMIPNPLTGKPGEKADGGKTYRGDNCIASFRFACVEFDSKPEPLWTDTERTEYQEKKTKRDAWEVNPEGPEPDRPKPPKMPLEWQYAFWAAFPGPLAALIFSGSKSLHAWLRVNLPDAVKYRQLIIDELFRKRLEPMGVDRATKNPARLFRAPSHIRHETLQWQRLIYLNPNPQNRAAIS
ncbi:hypothetical protein JXA40_04500 [bacterium]|nr:hypothetical protein [candidate division CSSED10-310 bacterium]